MRIKVSPLKEMAFVATKMPVRVNDGITQKNFKIRSFLLHEKCVQWKRKIKKTLDRKAMFI